MHARLRDTLFGDALYRRNSCRRRRHLPFTRDRVRYVVTGAAGFIGSHLVERLAALGHVVVGVDCFTDYYDPALKHENARGFDIVHLDLAEQPLRDLLAGIDGIFHLAGQPGVRSFGDVFPLYVRRNLIATDRVFAAAAETGTRVVFASSSSVYGDSERYPTPEDAVPLPLSPYGITKLSCEHLARARSKAFGLDAVVLRYFTVYGPRQRPDMAFTRLVRALASGETFELYGDGAQSRGFTYVGDAIEATVSAMAAAPSGAIYNVGGGTEATMLEVIEALERLTGRTLALRKLPRVPGDVRRTSADIGRIRRELGWRPLTSLADGLRAQWEWVLAATGAGGTGAAGRSTSNAFGGDPDEASR
jgi:nucleoside-diphosphate-sugar epimerase